MNLYLVSCTKKGKFPTIQESPIIPMNQDVYVTASDPAVAENAAIILLEKLGTQVDYVNNIKLLASTDAQYADGLLAISE